jgi:uridine kinase
MKSTMKFIGITGGSGAGKSTLCYALKNKYPDKIELIQLDDYFKPSEDKPKIDNIRNSDHPDALYLDKLADDLVELSRGESIMINTKNKYLNPEYEKTREKKPFTFYPKPIVFVEGFLVLHDKRVRELLDTSIFLDVEHNTRWERRANYTNKNKEYEEKVIIPMHNQYVEPTKKYAKHIIDISNLNKEEVLERVENIINNIIKL